MAPTSGSPQAAAIAPTAAGALPRNRLSGPRPVRVRFRTILMAEGCAAAAVAASVLRHHRVRRIDRQHGRPVRQRRSAGRAAPAAPSPGPARAQPSGLDARPCSEQPRLGKPLAAR